MNEMKEKLKPLEDKLEYLQKMMRYSQIDDEWLMIHNEHEKLQEKYKRITGMKYFKYI